MKTARKSLGFQIDAIEIIFSIRFIIAVIFLGMFSPQVVLPNLRQQSKIEMNRKMKWTQQPPNLDDYAPECLEKATGVPFQQAPVETEQVEVGQKRPHPSAGESSVKVPKHQPVPKSIKRLPAGLSYFFPKRVVSIIMI